MLSFNGATQITRKLCLGLFFEITRYSSQIFQSIPKPSGLSLYLSTNTESTSPIFSPIARAKLVHSKIEQHLKQNLIDPVVAKHISCKKGCTACCHTQVSVSHDEAELLVNKILSGSIKIDIDMLAKQAQAADDSTKWYKLDYQSRKCVFLDSEGGCSVYADRPSVCRSNYSISDASFCSTEDGVDKPHRLLNTHHSNMVLTAGYYAAKGGGALPHLLWKKITSKFDKKSRSNENNP